MTTFNVTYEIYPADMKHCEEGESGFVIQNVGLREALDYVNGTKSNCCSQVCIEASDSRTEDARWITVYNSANWDNGDTETRSLHIPDSVTGASRRRIAKLLGAR